tara:strand:+ start:244 stop:420 length:177 start_codon:yes stop_codon:yes gene_type:complete
MDIKDLILINYFIVGDSDRIATLINKKTNTSLLNSNYHQFAKTNEKTYVLLEYLKKRY